MTLDDDLHNLVIIGAVPAGKKLCHSDGRLFIDDATPWNGISRTLRRESRDRTVASIKRALQSVEERVEDLTLEIASKSSTSALRSRRLGMIRQAIESLPEGIDNLKATYVSDASVQAAFDLLHRQAASLIDRLRDLM